MPTRSIELVRHPLRVRKLQVRRIKQPRPRYQLITLGGADLGDFKTLSPTDHVGLIPPRAQNHIKSKKGLFSRNSDVNHFMMTLNI